jgi:TonB family protein
VKVDVFIDAQGTVRDVRVISSSDTRFSDVVVRKLKNAKFEPALDGAGNPMAVHMEMPIVFKLH